MQKKLDKLLKKKFSFFKNYKNNSFFFLVSRNRHANDITNIVGSIFINKKYQFNPIIISDLDFNANYHKLYKFFGLDFFIKIFRYKLILVHPIIFFLSVFYTMKCIIGILFFGFDWLINNFKLRSIKIGDLIYDTFTRYNHKYINPIVDLALINIIFKSTFRTIKSLDLLKNYRPKMILIGTDGYCYNDGIMMRIGIEKKIKVLEFQQDFLDENFDYNINFGKDYLKKKKKYLKNKISFKKLQKHYSLKINNKTKNAFTDLYYLANKNKNQKIVKEKFIKKYTNKSYFKKIVMIAPHAFSDAPHAAGKLIFRDYYHQLKETLKFLKKNKSLNDVLWIVKIHPGAFVYGEEIIYKNLLGKYLSNNIIDCPKNINTHNLISICDNVITSRSSVGIEFAAEGKMPILGAIAPYSHLGFTSDPKNKKEYFSIINNIKKIYPLNKSQVYESKKAMYYLDTGIYKNRIKGRSKLFDFDKMKDFWYKGLLTKQNKVNQINFVYKIIKFINNKNVFKDPYFKSLDNIFDDLYKK